MIRTLSRAQLTTDIVVAAALFVLTAGVALFARVPSEAVLVAFVMCGAIAVRRLSPPLALVGGWLGGVLQMATLQTPAASDLALLGVLYAVGAYGGRLSRWLGLASAIGGGLVAAIYLTASQLYVVGAPDASAGFVTAGRFWFELIATAIATITLFMLGWTLGVLARVRRASRQAKLQAAIEAQRVAYESAAEQERTRIARDMHDVVAHSLAVVIAQADGARYAGSARPELQNEALGTIAATARSALIEVRSLLTQLRREEPDGPQPSFDDIPALIAGMRAAGLHVIEQHSGAPAPLLQGTGLAAYRIVQEALTNALRHGDPTQPVTVGVRWEQTTLRLSIRNVVGPDASTRASGAASGHGVPGMRERAMLAGGTLTATPLEALEGVRSHFEVVAELPTASVSLPGVHGKEPVS